MENTISWKALEYKRKDKTVDWYWAVIIIALSLTVISIILHDALFAVLIILGTTTLLAFSIRGPQWVEITVDPRGFVVGHEMYPFATLDEFWVDITEENNHKILLKSKKLIMPLIVIPLEEHHHMDVREFLLEHLPEKELHEPLSQKVMEKLGF